MSVLELLLDKADACIILIHAMTNHMVELLSSLSTLF